MNELKSRQMRNWELVKVTGLEHDVGESELIDGVTNQNPCVNEGANMKLIVWKKTEAVDCPKQSVISIQLKVLSTM